MNANPNPIKVAKRGTPDQHNETLMEKPRKLLHHLSRYTAHISLKTWQQFLTHKCLQQASSLAFNTLLCLVPLSALALFLLKTFGVFENAESPLIVALQNNFLPRYGAEEIVTRLSDFANQNLGRLGAGGFLLFLVVTTMLFMSVEQHFNDIWGARRRLPLVQAFQKYAVFYTLLSVGPLLIWLFFSTTANWLFGHFLPWFLVYCLFLLMYIALPNTSVTWHSGLLGTFSAGTLFQIARLAFGRYLELVWQNYNEIYGALALLVVLALWIYVTWAIILFGAEVTHVAHNFQRRDLGQNQSHPMSNYITAGGVLKLFLKVAERFQQGEGASDIENLTAISGFPAELIDGIFARFKAAELIYEVEGDTLGYLPARALSEITLWEIISAVEGTLTLRLPEGNPLAKKTSQILTEFHTHQAETLQNITVDTLLSVNS